MQKGGKPKARPVTSAGRAMLVDYRSPLGAPQHCRWWSRRHFLVVLDGRTGTVGLAAAARDVVQLLLRQLGRLHFLHVLLCFLLDLFDFLGFFAHGVSPF